MNRPASICGYRKAVRPQQYQGLSRLGQEIKIQANVFGCLLDEMFMVGELAFVLAVRCSSFLLFGLLVFEDGIESVVDTIEVFFVDLRF